MEAGKWGRMNLVVAEAMAELTSGALDREQQGRLALGWMRAYIAGWAAGGPEDAWRRALGYSAEEWVGVRGTYADVLERPDGTWTLAFMHRESLRQQEVSLTQRGKASRRYSGMPEHAAADTGMQRHAEACPTTTTTTEPKNLLVSEGFSRFWDAYRCQRRRNRPAALKEWSKQGCEAVSDMVLAGLEAYKNGQQWRDGYMPEPARWLKARSWEDESPAEEAGPDPLWDMPARRGGAR